MQNRYSGSDLKPSLYIRFSFQPLSGLSHIKWRIADLQNREGDRSRSGGDFQRSDSSPGSRPSSVLPDLLTSSPGQRQDKSTSEEVRFIYMYSMFFVLYIDLLHLCAHSYTFVPFILHRVWTYNNTLLTKKS